MSTIESVKKWLVVHPSEDVDYNKMYDTESEAWNECAEDVVGYRAWDDMNDEKRKVIIEAAKMCDYKVIEVEITPIKA